MDYLVVASGKAGSAGKQKVEAPCSGCGTGGAERRHMGQAPMGTGNDFARGLSLPLDPQEAASAAAEDAKALKERLGPAAPTQWAR